MNKTRAQAWILLVLSLVLSAACWWRLDGLVHSYSSLHQDWLYVSLFYGLLGVALLAGSVALTLFFELTEPKHLRGEPKTEQADKV